MAARAAAAMAATVGALATGAMAVGGITLAASDGVGAATPIGGTASPSWHVILPDVGAPVAQSSPVPASLDAGGPAAVVGDRSGKVYALHLSDGSAVAGWPIDTAGPVDATPSVAAGPGGLDDVFVGSGDALDPFTGGYQSFGPAGQLRWTTRVQPPPTDPLPDVGVQASLTLLPRLGAGPAVVAGSLDQEDYALDATNGRPLPGWPFFASDSVFSTAAVADLYGTGRPAVVVGGDQTAGSGRGQTYTDGGHLRILNSRGGLVCHYDTDQTVDSSPAVGGFLGQAATGIVVGTGGFFPGAADTDRVLAFDTRCGLRWSTTLDGATTSSPALADVVGNGTVQVVEGTDAGAGAGSVWVLDGATGQPIWHEPVPGRVIGSVVVADLQATGRQDVLVPTTAGVYLFDGPTGLPLGQLGPADPTCSVAFQNSPLVTVEPGGVGITVAGYDCHDQGEVEHYVVPAPGAAPSTLAGAWPMFHHDPGLSGDAGGLSPADAAPPCDVPSAAVPGYDLAAADGGVFAFGSQPFCGSAGTVRLSAPVVGIAQAAAGGGYWLVAADGGVFAFGGAPFYGSVGGRPLSAPVVGMAATPDGGGYWLVAADGGVFAFGDARFFGSMGGRPLNRPVVGMSPLADGLGYRLVGADGGVFCFGSAHFDGSVGGQRLAAPVVGIALDVDTGGYWLVAADGGVFAFGAAPFYGSMGSRRLVSGVVGLQPSANGSGYWLVGADGGVFAFGAAPFYGSTGGRRLVSGVVGLSGN